MASAGAIAEATPDAETAAAPAAQGAVTEVCAETIASVVGARDGGAARVELCASLIEGGLTPSIGMIRASVALMPTFVLIRPRGGDFVYDSAELAVMEADVIAAREAGAAGIVTGVLDSSGAVDEPAMLRLVEAAKPLPVTFHRAIDVSSDCVAAVRACHRVGCARVLTSGGQASAVEGAGTIRDMVRAASRCGEGTAAAGADGVRRLTVVAGGGLRPDNVARVVGLTGVTEVHGSARVDLGAKAVFWPPHAVPMGGPRTDKDDRRRRGTTAGSAAAFVAAAASGATA